MSNTSTLDNRLAQIVHADRAELVSLAVVAIADHQRIYEGYFGSRCIDPANPANNLPVNAGTKFRIASISKVVATLGAMQLVERGLLDLDRDVSQYLGFKLRNPHYPDIPITTRMLVTHTSSIRDDVIYYIPMPYHMRDFFLPGGAEYHDGVHFAVPDPDNKIDPVPGQYFTYCNLNFGVLGTIMETVSGERFDQYMAAHVLNPLGLDASYNVNLLSDDGFSNLATLYCKSVDEVEVWDPDGPWYPQVDDYGGQRPTNIPRIIDPDTGEQLVGDAAMRILDGYELGTNGTLFSPQGGLRISAPDLAIIMQVFMNRGRYGDVVLLQPETVDDMMSFQWVYDKAANNGDTRLGGMCVWGLGLHYTTDTGGPGGGDKIIASGGINLWGHGGSAYGLLSGMWFDPKADVGLVFIMGGIGANPAEHTGRYSSFADWEEQIMTAVYEEVLKPYFDLS